MTKAGNALSTMKGWAVASLFRKALHKIRMNKLIQAGGIIFAALIVTHPAFASGTDLLSSQSSTVDSTFGSGSTMIKWFYMAEIIFGIFIYIKTRSPLTFIGVPLVIVATRTAFAIVS